MALTDRLVAPVLFGLILAASATGTGRAATTESRAAELFEKLRPIVAGSYYQPGGATSVDIYATLAVAGSILETMGDFYLSGGTIRAGAGYFLDSTAVLSGWGTVTANVSSVGLVFVGGTGTMETLHIASDLSAGIAGDYSQSGTGHLVERLFAPGVCDHLMIDGMAGLGGRFGALTPDLTPIPGARYDLIFYGGRSGTFDVVDVPQIWGGMLVPDYDHPAGIFALVWQSSDQPPGPPSPPPPPPFPPPP